MVLGGGAKTVCGVILTDVDHGNTTLDTGQIGGDVFQVGELHVGNQQQVGRGAGFSAVAGRREFSSIAAKSADSSSACWPSCCHVARCWMNSRNSIGESCLAVAIRCSTVNWTGTCTVGETYPSF